MKRAIATLQANNVPPAKCPACGKGYYVMVPRGWEPGEAIPIVCECGNAFDVGARSHT